MHMPLFLFSVLIGIAVHCFASPPVPFSGKIAVEGINFHGTARFTFSIVDGEGQEYWRHAEDEQATIENFVLNGVCCFAGRSGHAAPSTGIIFRARSFTSPGISGFTGRGGHAFAGA